MKITLQRFLHVQIVFPFRAKQALQEENVTCVDIVKTPSIHPSISGPMDLEKLSREILEGRDG